MPSPGAPPGGVKPCGAHPGRLGRLQGEQLRAEGRAIVRRGERARGLGTNLLEADALLTLEEVVAIRLYSGPAYAPINAFLRQVAKLDGVFLENVETLTSAEWK